MSRKIVAERQSRRDDTLLTVGGASEAPRNLRTEVPLALSWQSRRDGALLTADFNLRKTEKLKKVKEKTFCPRKFSILNFQFSILLLLLVSLTGCKTAQTAKSDSHREATRIEYRDRLRTDSIYVYQRDSIHIRERSDTVFVDRYRTQIAYRDRLRVDTVNVTDTVRVTVHETVIEETNRLTGWQWFQIWAGRIAAGLTAVYLMFKKLRFKV